MVVYYQVAGKKVGSHVVSARHPLQPSSNPSIPYYHHSSKQLELLPRKLTALPH